MGDKSKLRKIVLATAVGLLVVSGVVYFAVSPQSKRASLETELIITKVIDGDTVVAEGGNHIRLLGIDADEKGYPCYKPAKKRLEQLVLGKRVQIEKDVTDTDKYGRYLRYIFVDKKNVNLQLVKEGLVVARFYQPDVKYEKEITAAEKEAINNKIGCKWRSPEWINTENNDKDKVVPAREAENYLGEDIIVEGKIVDSYRSDKSAIFLNFGAPYPNQVLTAIIFSSALSRFKEHPRNYYLGKLVRIRGKVKEYKGRPEIILDTPSQIKILKNY